MVGISAMDVVVLRSVLSTYHETAVGVQSMRYSWIERDGSKGREGVEKRGLLLGL